jgi:ATP-dependent DNA helicase RecG
LREAFVNALIHGDYSAPGGLVIERLPHEITIENAGTLLVGLEQYRRGGMSECRNPGLQKMFRMIGGGEHAGSGAEKIRAGWRHQHWRAPLLKTFDHPDRVRLELPTVSLIPDQTLVSLRERFGPQVAALSSSELQALATAQIEGAVSNSRLQELVVDHPVDITRMLTNLCERGLLVSDNRRRWTTYELSRRGLEASQFDADDASQPSGDAAQLSKNLGELAGDSLDKATDSLGMAGSSLHNGRDSLGMAGSSLHNGRDSLDKSAGGADALRQLAEPVRDSRRASTAVIRGAIVALCMARFLTLRQLAELLGRNEEHLRGRYLAPMVREGLLRQKYPQATNRPDQAYTTAGDE